MKLKKRANIIKRILRKNNSLIFMNFKDAFEIMRPVNCIMGGLTVIIGVLNTRQGISTGLLIINIILGVLTYFCIAGSGMIINDYYDFKSGIDQINRPDRPIPRGSI
ncbi:MAG: hypothetical protein EU521_01085, partial [Promethearchaeota archaeon]